MKIEPNRKSRFEATFSIKFAHARPKTPSPSKPSNDGDIHISGTAPEIGLLTVAEIMNAVDFPRTLAFIQTKRAGDPVRMMGYGESGPSTVANPTTRRSRPTRTTSQTPTRITTSRSTLKCFGIERNIHEETIPDSILWFSIR